jgi:hypothetical protein
MAPDCVTLERININFRTLANTAGARTLSSRLFYCARVAIACQTARLPAFRMFSIQPFGFCFRGRRGYNG